MDFDPYKRWLRIEDSSQPNHYQLLGLRLFTEDSVLIREAYAVRYEAVHPYQAGKHGAAAQKLIDELSVALRCLTDQESKRKYDRDLRSALSTRETVFGSSVQDNTVVGQLVPAEGGVATSNQFNGSEPPAVHALPQPPLASSPIIKRGRRKSSLPLHVVLALLGLIVSLSALGVFGWRLAWTIVEHDDSAVATVMAAPTLPDATTLSARPVDSAVLSTSEISGDENASIDAGTDAGDSVPVARPIVESPDEVVKLPVPTDDTEAPALDLPLEADLTADLPMPAAIIEEVPLIGSFFGAIPAAVALPSLTGVFSDDVVPLLTFQRRPDESLTLEIDSSACDLEQNQVIVASPVPDSSTSWVVSLQWPIAGTEALAELTLQDEQLLFDWQANETLAGAEQLRNCFLTLGTQHETHVVALREPLVLLSDFLPDGRDYRVPFYLPNLPESRHLRVDIAIDYDGHASTAAKGSIGTLSQKLDFRLNGFLGGKMEVEVMLVPTRDGSLALRAAPRYRSRPDKTIEASLKAFKLEWDRLHTLRGEDIVRRNLLQRQSRPLDSRIFQTGETLKQLKAFRASDLVRLKERTTIQYKVYAQAGSRKLILVDGGRGDPSRKREWSAADDSTGATDGLSDESPRRRLPTE